MKNDPYTLRVRNDGKRKIIHLNSPIRTHLGIKIGDKVLLGYLKDKEKIILAKGKLAGKILSSASNLSTTYDISAGEYEVEYENNRIYLTKKI